MTRSPMLDLDTGRLAAFSDGVLAIAITLLVLEIGVPEGKGPLLDRLVGQWQVYLAFVISFVVIGAVWISHHHLFGDIRAVDHGLLLANLALLLVVSFIPFPTAVVGQQLRANDVADQRTAALLYGLTFVALAMAFNALWWWAKRGRRLLRVDLLERDIAGRSRRYLLGIPAYAFTSALALLSPQLSIIATGLVALSFLLPGSQISVRDPS